MEGILIFGMGLAVYFLPLAIAYNRDHRSYNAIGVVNFLFGWTVIGWLWALIWSLTGNIESHPVSAQRRVPCPQCAELVLPAAKVCKHCGYSISKDAP